MSGYHFALNSASDQTLSEDGWEALAYAVLETLTNHLEAHLETDAELAVLDVLDDVVEVDCDALAAGDIAFVLHDHYQLGAECAHHWFTYALAGAWEVIANTLVEAGQRLLGSRPDLEVEYGPRESCVFASFGPELVGVYATGEALIGTEDGEVLVQYDSETLNASLREQTRALFTTRLCRCTLCERSRPAGLEVV